VVEQYRLQQNRLEARQAIALSHAIYRSSSVELTLPCCIGEDLIAMAKPTQMLRIIANGSCFVIMANPAYLGPHCWSLRRIAVTAA
jgi:hypothetical protein